ncbi:MULTISPECIES: hypothetical protein [Burkholderia cepacia complex]|uniref:hypothetical protein n=1 Tax=Burkholderia cepacia complex TaxID=87882 RepID=UPI000A6CA866|nr:MULTISPECIES: hypothetical protein [Burkholderia cepacia complex]
MPEQITKYPEVMLQVLKGAGAICGQGVTQNILTQCPPARFCKLPSGEICVYGINEIPRMTQIDAREIAAVVAPKVQPDLPTVLWATSWVGAVILVGGVLAGFVLGRYWKMAVGRWAKPGIGRAPTAIKRTPNEMKNRTVGFRAKPANHRSFPDRFFRHPSVLLILGFLLTGVLGTMYSSWRERQDRTAELNVKEVEAHRLATARLVQSIYLLELRSYRLYDALTHTIPAEEVRDKNREYEQAASDFGTSLFANVQLAKSVVPDDAGPAGASIADPAVLLMRLQKLFIDVDQCLHGMYLTWAAQANPKPIASVCFASNQHVNKDPINRIELVRKCGTDIADALMNAEANAKFDPQQRYHAFVHELPKSSACASPQATPSAQ